MSLIAMLHLVFTHSIADGQSVTYELTDGSYIEERPCSSPRATAVDLMGTFVLDLAQSTRTVDAGIRDIRLQSRRGDYLLEGQGTFFLFPPPGIRTCLPAALGVDLLLNINGTAGIYFTTELTMARTFPGLSVRLHRFDGPRVCEDCCIDSLNIQAVPVKEDALRFFRRGDINGDLKMDVSDPISGLSFLFLGSSEPSCVKSSDVDDDGKVNVGDFIVLLGVLFLGSASIEVPSCFCGVDPTDDGLTCNGQPACLSGN